MQDQQYQKLQGQYLLHIYNFPSSTGHLGPVIQLFLYE
jgi:hypothetical protein